MKAIYGVNVSQVDKINQTVRKLKETGVNSAFVARDKRLIDALHKNGLCVFFSINAFGGVGTWNQFPELRPITHTGELLDTMDGYGGICPSNEPYRQRKLNEISNLLREYPIDGIWLDFIRYPTKWEVKNPDIQRTCFCSDCLTKFSHDTNVKLPHNLTTVEEKANWILKFHGSTWNKWRGDQITSFVRDVRRAISEIRPKALLGIFAVPWRKGDFEGAIIWGVAQDFEKMSPYVDAFSPMVYHEMCGRPVTWISEITDYFSIQTKKPVYPIIQTESITSAEFEEAIHTGLNPPSSGIIIFTFPYLDKEKWKILSESLNPPN